MPLTTPGLFIMIDGIDGSGKGLQTDRLKARLVTNGFPVETISFPQYGHKSAAPIEDYLTGAYGSAEEVGPYRASILYSIDRYAAAPTIRTWLNQGHIVVANRYVSSNMGHQGGKIDDFEERQKFFTWNYELEYSLFGIPKPDLQLILHVDSAVAQTLIAKKEARTYLQGGKHDIHEEDLTHLQKAERTYLEIATLFPEFTLVECMENSTILPPEAIEERIWRLVSPRLPQHII